MITAYAEKVNFDELMKKLSQEIYFYQNLPVINQIKKEGEYPFRILISTVLSSRTKDEVTAKASEKLFSKAPDSQRLSQLPEMLIRELIYPVGFYRIKAKNIKKIAKILLKKYNGLVPDNRDDLIKLPGVGRKTANLVLGIAFDIDSITVDTHVHRISNRLGIVKTTKPAETEQDLQIILPKKYWISFNTYLVLHGQSICKPISPICSQCNIISFCQRISVGRSR
ncbi:MAG: endonuclease III domain-containing protein [Atribacterota bacterium]